MALQPLTAHQIARYLLSLPDGPVVLATENDLSGEFCCGILAAGNCSSSNFSGKGAIYLVDGELLRNYRTRSTHYEVTWMNGDQTDFSLRFDGPSFEESGAIEFAARRRELGFTAVS